MTLIRPISDLRNRANEISEICHNADQPIFITKNGQGDLVVMSQAHYERLHNLLELYQKLGEAEALNVKITALEVIKGAPVFAMTILGNDLKQGDIFSKIVTHRQDDERRAKNTFVCASCTLSSTEGVLILIRLTEKSIYEMNLEVQICYDSLTSTKEMHFPRMKVASAKMAVEACILSLRGSMNVRIRGAGF